MNRIIIALSSVAALGLVGCQQADNNVVAKLDEISSKLDKLADIEKKLDNVGAGARPTPSLPAPGRPDPADVFAVSIAGAPVVGPADAKVTIVKAFEFACPFCLRVKPTLEQIEKEYGKDVRIVYMDYIVHPSVATTPALAACAAHKQGKYKPMYDLIWDKGFSANRNLGEENMMTLAKELKLDAKKFEADMKGDECQKRVQQDQAQLAAVGTRGTPAFYINGRFLSGAQPFERFKAVIDEELKKVDAAAKNGVKVSEYYEKEVLGKGKKSL